MRDLIHSIYLFIGTLFAGVFGSIFCGFIVISFGFYIGKSGSTGLEYIGFWNPKYALFLAITYATPLGLLFCPTGYFLFLQRISLFKAVWITTLSTLIGGCIGAAGNLFFAAIMSVISFFGACVVLSIAEYDRRKDG